MLPVKWMERNPLNKINRISAMTEIRNGDEKVRWAIKTHLDQPPSKNFHALWSGNKFQEKIPQLDSSATRCFHHCFLHSNKSLCSHLFREELSITQHNVCFKEGIKQIFLVKV